MGGHIRGGPYGGKKYFSPYGNPRLSDGPDGEHLPDRLATGCDVSQEATHDLARAHPHIVGVLGADLDRSETRLDERRRALEAGDQIARRAPRDDEQQNPDPAHQRPPDR